jgi:apolipoprotein N-acyltransferase
VLRHPKLLALAAGAVSATGFEPLGLWPVTLACFALLIEILWRAPNWRGAFARSWLFALGHFVIGLNWIAHAFTYQEAMPHWFGYGAVVALSLYLAVYPGLGAVIARLLFPRPEGERIGFVCAVAAAWIATEWLRATMFTGFAWNPLGVALLDTPWAASARLIGTYGLSGLAVLAAGSLWLLSHRQWRGGGAIGMILRPARAVRWRSDYERAHDPHRSAERQPGRETHAWRAD